MQVFLYGLVVISDFIVDTQALSEDVGYIIGIVLTAVALVVVVAGFSVFVLKK